MSNRSLLEFNHDLAPSATMSDETRLVWADALINYLRSGDPMDLPAGVTFFNRRHHSEPCPLGDPPRGWHNDRPGNLTIKEIDPRGARRLGNG